MKLTPGFGVVDLYSKSTYIRENTVNRIDTVRPALKVFCFVSGFSFLMKMDASVLGEFPT